MESRTMMLLALAALAMTWLGGCRDVVEEVQGKDLRWNGESLGPAYQAEFEAALAWWGGGLGPDSGATQRAEWNLYLGDGLRAAYWNSHPRRILFNGAKDWSLPQFCYASRHELGHFLGLPDSNNPNDVMYPQQGEC